MNSQIGEMSKWDESGLSSSPVGIPISVKPQALPRAEAQNL